MEKSQNIENKRKQRKYNTDRKQNVRNHRRPPKKSGYAQESDRKKKCR
jgi:hypothetical protein